MDIVSCSDSFLLAAIQLKGNLYASITFLSKGTCLFLMVYSLLYKFYEKKFFVDCVIIRKIELKSQREIVAFGNNKLCHTTRI